MSLPDSIEKFLAAKVFAVAGASKRRKKYGNKVLRCYQQHQRKVYPLNPATRLIEGLTAYPSLAEIPEIPEAVSIITPPVVTESIVDQAIELKVSHLWMQPGAESPDAVARAEDAGINVIADGSCLLVVLGYQDDWTPEGL